MKKFNLKEITWYEWIGIASILVLLAVQLSSLYHTPIHDSYLWWGDESWLMNEYIAQLSSGVFRYPQAYGSTLNVGNPFPFTSMWVTSILYGCAGLLGGTAIIDGGRTLTAMLSIALLLSVFVICRKFGVSVLISLLAIALLVSSRTFFLTSHSARYDILTSLAITTSIFFLFRKMDDVWSSRSYLLLGTLWAVGILISVHVSLLLILPIIVFLICKKGRITNIFLFAASGGITLGLLYLIHFLTQPSLLEANNLNENLSTIPILRPFSRSVQFANLEQKLGLIRDFASVAGGATILLSFGFFRRNRSSRFLPVLLVLPLVGWLALQSAGPSSYLIHFLPCLIIGAAITVNTAVTKWPVAGRVVSAFTIIFAASTGTIEAIQAGEIGQKLTENNRKVLSSAVSSNTYISLNPAISYLQQSNNTFATTHFIELPSEKAEHLNGSGYLLTYNSSIIPGFMWEVNPLRAEVVSPHQVATGHFLDVGRSYFGPLSDMQDTLFVQPIDLSALYKRHIH